LYKKKTSLGACRAVLDVSLRGNTDIIHPNVGIICIQLINKLHHQITDKTLVKLSRGIYGLLSELDKMYETPTSDNTRDKPWK